LTLFWWFSSSLDQRWSRAKRLILVKKIHSINCEETHIFSNQEGQMSKVVFVIVHHCSLHLRMSPLIVSSISKFISLSHKHGNRDLPLDVLNGNYGRCWLSIDLLILTLSIVIVLELRWLNKLSIMNKTVKRGSWGEVTHIDSESIWIIKVNIFITDKVNSEFAKFWNSSTNELHGSSSGPVGWEQVIDSKKFAGVDNQSIMFSKEV